MIALPIYLQMVLEYNAMQAGLSLAPLSLTMEEESALANWSDLGPHNDFHGWAVVQPVHRIGSHCGSLGTVPLQEVFVPAQLRGPRPLLTFGALAFDISGPTMRRWATRAVDRCQPAGAQVRC